MKHTRHPRPLPARHAAKLSALLILGAVSSLSAATPPLPEALKPHKLAGRIAWEFVHQPASDGNTTELTDFCTSKGVKGEQLIQQAAKIAAALQETLAEIETSSPYFNDAVAERLGSAPAPEAPPPPTPPQVTEPQIPESSKNKYTELKDQLTLLNAQITVTERRMKLLAAVSDKDSNHRSAQGELKKHQEALDKFRTERESLQTQLEVIDELAKTTTDKDKKRVVKIIDTAASSQRKQTLESTPGLALTKPKVPQLDQVKRSASNTYVLLGTRVVTPYTATKPTSAVTQLPLNTDTPSLRPYLELGYKSYWVESAARKELYPGRNKLVEEQNKLGGFGELHWVPI